MGWLDSFLRSLALAAGSVLVATSIAIPTWWILVAGPSRRRSLARIAILVSIAIAATPILVHAMTWEASIGRFGYWTTLIGGRSAVFLSYYGAAAAVWVHGYVGAAWMFLVLTVHWRWVGPRFNDRLRLECRDTSETVARMGRLMLPAWSLAVAWIGLLAMTEMTVADLYAFTTLPDRFYRRFAVTADLDRVAIESLPWALVIGWAGAWTRHRSGNVFDALRSRDALEGNVTTDSVRKRTPDCPRAWLNLAMRRGWIAAIAIVMVGIPTVGWIGRVGYSGDGAISGFLIAERLRQSFVENRSELMWTMVLAVATAMISVAAAWFVVLTTTSKRRTRFFADWTSLALFCIPAPIIGLAFAAFFTLPVPGFRTLYQSTLIPTLLALSCKAGPVAYLVLSFAWRGTSQSLRDRSRLDHSPLRRIVWEYPRWLIGPRWVAVAASTLIVAGDVAITMRVTPPSVSTAAARLFGLLHSGARFQEAALGFWFAAIALLSVAMIAGLSTVRPHRRLPSMFR